MAATVWKGYLTFGLVSIPIRLFSAARGVRVEFHQLHAPDLTRVKQQLYCPEDDKVVSRSEIVKGYEVGKGEWVVIEDEEIRKVAPPSSQTMEILQVVKVADVDPIYFETSYYTVPEEAGRKAYSVLYEAMKRGKVAAIAKLSMHRREYTVVIRPYGNGLTLHTIYYANEVRRVAEYHDFEAPRTTDKEIQLADQLLATLEAPFRIEEFKDSYQERLRELVEAKAEGKTVRATEKKKVAPVIDLMAALRQSLESTAAQRKPAGKTAARASKPAAKRAKRAA
jgi:DNA end-binding protein Ku